jgi:hypothetical protein
VQIIASEGSYGSGKSKLFVREQCKLYFVTALRCVALV